MSSRSASALRLSSSRIAIAGRRAQAAAQLVQIVERIARAHARCPPLVDRRLQPAAGLLGVLVAADEVAHVVAGAAVAPLGHACFGPALELVRNRDVHLRHLLSYRI